ncbi:kinase-like domain-containing protein [Cladorrhinum sp. PSN332]|nr:kinase-like domain-containing protein [Cladorrhinum sp. PSN332]
MEFSPVSLNQVLLMAMIPATIDLIKRRTTDQDGVWYHGLHIGTGSYGSAIQEICTEGRAKGQVRVVTKIRNSRQDFEQAVILREIYALTKISQVMLGFAHRDLKPGNILLTSLLSSPAGKWSIKLCDFGFALDYRHEFYERAPPREYYRHPKPDLTDCGTDLYNAPEVWGHYVEGSLAETALSRAQKRDIWALGETAFELLTGKNSFTRMPWAPDSDLARYARGEITFPELEVLKLGGVPSAAAHLILRLMAPKNCVRPSASETLKCSTWLQGGEE